MIHTTREQTKNILYQKLESLLEKDRLSDTDIKFIATIISGIKDIEQIEFMNEERDFITHLHYDIADILMYLKRK